MLHFLITASFDLTASGWFPDTVQPGSRWSGALPAGMPANLV